MKNLSENITQSGEHNVTFNVEGNEQGSGYLSPINTTSEYGIILLQEWWGMNKSITITADTFAAKGFRVLCPDLYRGKVAIDHETAGHLMTGLHWQNGLKDVQGAMNHLKSLGCKHVGITGFCMGGALTIAAVSTIDGFKAAAPFYGVPDLNTYSPKNVKVPIFAHFAELDCYKGFSDTETALRLEKEMKEAGVQFTLKIWKGVDHAFMNQDSQNYNIETSKQALDDTCQFFLNQFSN